MPTKFQVTIHHQEGYFARKSYADGKHKRAGFWATMKAKFDSEVEPFNYQFQQSVTTKAARVNALSNNKQFMNEIWTPQMDYNDKEILKPAEPNTDYAKDMTGYRYFREDECWYKYNKSGLLKVCNPSEKDNDIQSWDIWIADEPGYEDYKEGDFVVFDFTGTCNLVKVWESGEYLEEPILIAKIGPYTAYWRGIWPYRKTNIPENGLCLNWDGQVLNTKLPQNEGYIDKFLIKAK